MFSLGKTFFVDKKKLSMPRLMAERTGSLIKLLKVSVFPNYCDCELLIHIKH